MQARGGCVQSKQTEYAAGSHRWTIRIVYHPMSNLLLAIGDQNRGKGVEKGTKILVVDDFSTMRKITRTLLGKLGYANVEEADDGLAALVLLLEGRFDFLITDWDMPGMTGIDLLRAVRADPVLADLPVLMVSSEARREEILMAEAAGVDGYIVKPYTVETLRDRIEYVRGCRAVA